MHQNPTKWQIASGSFGKPFLKRRQHLGRRVNYRYHFTKRPVVVDPDALSRDDVKLLVEACRTAGPLIPDQPSTPVMGEDDTRPLRATGVR